MLTKRDASIRAHKRLPTSAAWLAALLAVAAMIAFSPLILQAASSAEIDWARLSEMGQAYGAISALLSALALCGIVASLLLLRKQLATEMILADRDRHFELIKLALDNADLHWRRDGEELRSFRRTTYMNAWFTYWYTSWNLELITEDRLRFAVFGLFNDFEAQLWWSEVGTTWLAGNEPWAKRHESFSAIVTAEYALASALHAE